MWPDRETPPKVSVLAVDLLVDGVPVHVVVPTVAPAPTPPSPTPPPVPAPIPPPVPVPAPPAPPTPPRAATEIALVDESTIVGDGTVESWAVVLQIQADQLTEAWSLPAVKVTHYATLAAVPKTAEVLAILDNADQAGALGYHDVTPDGRPYGRVFVRDCLAAGVDASTCASHECCEIILDPDCDQWKPGPAGKDYALEACDPVESGVYWITPPGRSTTAVSDFVLPAYFGLHAPVASAISYAGARGASFTVQPGGYQIIRDASGNETQVFGQVAAWRRAGKAFPAARSARRGVAL